MGLRTYGLVLEKEFENLNVVLTLSHFGLHLLDSGEPVVREASPPCPTHALPGPSPALKPGRGEACPFTCPHQCSPTSLSPQSHAVSVAGLYAGAGGVELSSGSGDPESCAPGARPQAGHHQGLEI